MQKNIFSRINRKQKQQGFVLILALVLLAVLTLIGVSSMNSSNIELKATANSQQHSVAFNVVQSVLEFAISDAGVALIDYQNTSAVSQAVTHNVAKSSALSATATYVGCTVGVGSSLEDGKGFSYNFYTIAGSGSNATRTANSLQNQGVRYISASCSTS